VAAGLATLRGDYERAARLHGVAAAQAAETGLQRDAADEAFLAPLVARARAGLPAGAFAAAEAAGREQALDATLAELRTWLAPGAGQSPAAGNG
jgi:hypothetical protein